MADASKAGRKAELCEVFSLYDLNFSRRQDNYCCLTTFAA